MGNKIHTVIFDMDGTLTDSAILTIAAFRKIAPGQGLKEPSEEAIKKAMGNPTPEFYYLLFPDLPKEAAYDIGILVDQEELRLLPFLKDELLFPGCRELLMLLKKNKIRIFLASTGAKEHVYPILKITGIIDLFDTISCGFSDKIKMISEMAKDGPREGYVMVGDMEKDHAGAKANGIVSVGACFGYCRRELTTFNYYIDEPLDLLKIINWGDINAAYNNP